MENQLNDRNESWLEMKSNDMSLEIYRAAPHTWLLLAELILVNSCLYTQFRAIGWGESFSLGVTSVLLILSLTIPNFIAPHPSQYKFRLRLTHRYVLPILVSLFLVIITRRVVVLNRVIILIAPVYYLILLVFNYRSKKARVEVFEHSSKPELDEFGVPKSRYIAHLTRVVEDEHGRLSLIGDVPQVA